MGFAASTMSHFGLLRAAYSIVCKFSLWISFSALPFIYLNQPWPVLSPSQLFSTILPNQLGILKASFASSLGQLSATPFATFTSVSIPTTSAVRNVADLGL